jgi:hypothetical protein
MATMLMKSAIALTKYDEGKKSNKHPWVHATGLD